LSLLPQDNVARKGLPLWLQVTRYFPKALREITKVSVVNNVRYNPGRDPFDINWARGKSNDQLGSGFRHMLESEVDGKVFEEVPEEVARITGITRIYVLAENAWRANAALELAIEKQEALEAEYAALAAELDGEEEEEVALQTGPSIKVDGDMARFGQFQTAPGTRMELPICGQMDCSDSWSPGFEGFNIKFPQHNEPF
jgi:hypothetical protein